MLLGLKDYFAEGHSIELWYNSDTELFDDMRCVRIVAHDSWYQCESDDIFEARSTAIDHAMIAGICYLNVASDEPLSLEWLSGVTLDLDPFLRAGHRLVLTARNWEALSNENICFWVNIGYADGDEQFYVEYQSVTDTTVTDDSDEAFDIGMGMIAELESLESSVDDED